MTLEIRHLQVSYGRAPAVLDVNLSVEAGEIIALVGPNGAGKSTTLLAVAGAVKPKAGEILFEGKPLLGLAPEQRVKRHLAMVPEGREIFTSMSVADNLQVGWSLGKAKGASRSVYDNLLDLFPILGSRLKQPAGQLSGGEQQQLAIARALLTEPRCLLIDEPSLGLAPLVTDRVYGLIGELRNARGLSVLVVEQSMRRVLSVADRVYVMREGRTGSEFARDQFADQERMEQAYFG
jgi:branched-chain amino acid transport system ATP-binding protein